MRPKRKQNFPSKKLYIRQRLKRFSWEKLLKKLLYDDVTDPNPSPENNRNYPIKRPMKLQSSPRRESVIKFAL